AEDGIRDFHVTGVQTCALPICALAVNRLCYRSVQFNRKRRWKTDGRPGRAHCRVRQLAARTVRGGEALWPVAVGCGTLGRPGARSEERRVGKECRSRGGASP